MPDRTDPTAFEPRPNPSAVAPNIGNDKSNSTTNTSDVDYTPHPPGIAIPTNRQSIVDSITALYSGVATDSKVFEKGEKDMQVYSEKAIYDDPWSYCDNRYKIAGQWYGIPKIMASSRTLATEIVSSTDNELVFKLRQEYKPRLLPAKAVNSLISLTLTKEVVNGEEVERVKYHKDMWNAKDYSHEGLGKILKTLNGDYLTGITRPPKDLKDPEK